MGAMTNSVFESTLSQLLNAPRLSSVTAAAGRVTTTVQQLNQQGSGYVNQLWDVTTAAVQLTHSDDSVASVQHAKDGRIFFLSSRKAVAEDPEAPTAAGTKLWVMPPLGEPYVVAQRSWGFQGLKVVGGQLVVSMQWHSNATTETEHEQLATTRSTAKVSGVVYTQFPTRYWDQDLPQGRTVLAVAPLPEPGDAPKFTRVELPAGRLVDWDVTADGRQAVVTMSQQRGNTPETVQTSVVYRLDLGTGEYTELLVSTPQTEYEAGAISPDGQYVVITMATPWHDQVNLAMHTAVLELRSGQLQPVWSQLDRWVTPQWLTSKHLIASTDEQGAGAIYVGGLNDAIPTRITPSLDTWTSHAQLDAVRAYGPITTDPKVNTDDDAVVYAVASGIAASPQLVKFQFNPSIPDTVEPIVVETAVPELTSPGRLDTLSAIAEDGTSVRAWLRLPEGEGPFPLVVLIHGGPWGSWNAWTYRWNPDPFVAAGYAVLLPDPAISTGYGQAMINRGNQQLGGTPFSDLLALIDSAEARVDIATDKTAIAGGSYGGYLANWVAGHTGQRFRCIITHASLWDTTAMGQTTDNATWDRAMATQQHYSPHRYAKDIAVPILIIHGDKDYRVPIGQAQQLWHALHTVTPPITDAAGDTAHRYLYFPDEGHWVDGRGNAEVWYKVFRNFLAAHIEGSSEELPAELG